MQKLEIVIELIAGAMRNGSNPMLSWWDVTIEDGCLSLEVSGYDLSLSPTHECDEHSFFRNILYLYDGARWFTSEYFTNCGIDEDTAIRIRQILADSNEDYLPRPMWTEVMA